jgi:transcriptional repressor NrdR
MMKCPFCNQENTRVIDSRPVPDNNSIRRRRQCDECHKRFTTYEKIETIPLTVIKKDQSRETYDRTKIQDGIMRACYKRPISVEQIERTIDEIETEIFNKEGNSKYGNRRDCDEPLKRIRCGYVCPFCLCLSGI